MANILIVDDSKFMRKMLSDILMDAGHKISGEAENATEAVKLHRQLNPDLVTMDIIMPVIDGVDALSALKELIDANSGTKIIMISTMGQKEIIKEYIEAGAKDFIIKPFEPFDVTEVVKSVLMSSEDKP